ncbi:hypothetical protein BK004_05005 [bacterium CG10_46_32]|nr:MAG: hypothetical protein BK004_05005 [bacterium CG10_46_32]PIR55673.1 MAG: endolytic transglycosylase MltG [Parcubacteria group bacterium CG10_big_fil_rev_8_21_14_0_10_46_32]
MIKTVPIVTAFAAVAIATFLYIGYQFFGSVSVANDARELVVAPGETVKNISADLSVRNVIKNDFWFRTLVWLRGKESKFLAGTFLIPERVSSWELIQLLTRSARKEVATITILEGWDIRNIAIYFENQGMFQQEEITELVGLPGIFSSSDNDFYNELAVQFRPLVYRTAAAPLEGFLFPDTYEVFADASLKDIITKMVANFDSKVTPELRDEIARQHKNFYDVLIMASIIEAEVPHEDDRAIVSDIFWSRLESGVALQSDATLHYIIGGSSPSLTSEQLEINSQYNTYKYQGLPPTPIGNPGISAIRAAIYPANTDYFYFLSTPEGKTIFSRTLEEHNAAKFKYLN